GPAPLYIRQKLCSVEEIKTSLIELISGKYDNSALEAGEKIRQENGIKAAADAVEQYITS
ncbi:MAG: hypothetical protein IJ711_02570, partial [Lachnospiraceae bacterium]|nr:hypothetical protein [Lachnospiraceae bacterium]